MCAPEVSFQCTSKRPALLFDFRDSMHADGHDIVHGFSDTHVLCFLPVCFCTLLATGLGPGLLEGALVDHKGQAARLIWVQTLIISLLTRSAIKFLHMSSPVHSQQVPSLDMIWWRHASPHTWIRLWSLHTKRIGWEAVPFILRKLQPAWQCGTLAARLGLL